MSPIHLPSLFLKAPALFYDEVKCFMCGKLFIAHFPPPLERGIVIIYYKYCIWVYLDFFIVRAVTLILMIGIRQSCYLYFVNGLEHRG